MTRPKRKPFDVRTLKAVLRRLNAERREWDRLAVSDTAHRGRREAQRYAAECCIHSVRHMLATARKGARKR